MDFDFRVSDSDLATYYFMLGYKLTDIEVTIDKRHFNRIKAFMHFDGDKNELIKIQKGYINNEPIGISLKDFSINRQKINKLVKKSIKEFEGK